MTADASRTNNTRTLPFSVATRPMACRSTRESKRPDTSPAAGMRGWIISSMTATANGAGVQWFGDEFSEAAVLGLRYKWPAPGNEIMKMN